MRVACIILSTFLILLFAGESPAQPRVQWDLVIDGEGITFPRDMVKTADGGFVLAGTDVPPNLNSSEISLIKVDSSGEVEWSRMISEDDYTSCFALANAVAGGFILAGYVSDGNERRLFLVKTGEEGEVGWSQVYRNRDGIVNSIIRTQDDGYVLAGQIVENEDENIFMMKTNDEGRELWWHVYGGERYEDCQEVIETEDEGLVIAGSTESFGAGNQDYYLIKTNSAGEIQWSRTFGGRSFDNAHAVIQTPDGGYAIAGQTESFGAGDSDILLVKTDDNGQQQWRRTFGNANGEVCTSLLRTFDGGYALAGSYRRIGVNRRDLLLVRANMNGDEEWSFLFDSGIDERCYSMVSTDDGEYVLSGYAAVGHLDQDFLMVKTNPDPLTPLVPLDVTFNLGWNLISLNIMLPPEFYADDERRGHDFRLALDQLKLNDEQHRVVIAKDERGRLYIPEFDFLNIPYWNMAEGYMIKVNQSVQTRWRGWSIPPDTEIPLEQGWNLVSYYPDYELACTMPEVYAFESIEDNLIVAKDDQGRFCIPAYNFSNLNNLQPGRGYQVKVSENVILTYPEPRDEIFLEHLMSDIQVPTHWNSLDHTGSNMSVLVKLDSDGGVIGAFTSGGLLVGAGAVTNGWCGMSVWGDDFTTASIDGLVENEIFSLCRWDGSSEIPLEVTGLSEGDRLNYESDGLIVLDVTDAAPFEYDYSISDFFPNPFNDLTQFNFVLHEQEPVSVGIYDISGRLVRKLTDDIYARGPHTLYWLAKTEGSGVFFAHICIGDLKTVRKIVHIQ